MSFNQIAFQGQPASARIAAFLQNAGQQVISQTYGGVFQHALAPGETMLLPPGQWLAQAGPYSDLQYWDNQSQMWRNLFANADVAPLPVSADGTNLRFANLSGCPVGAVITTAGTTLGATYPVTMFTPNGSWVGGSFTAAATPALVVTPSAGGSTWNTFIGGAINTSVTITSGGAGYTVIPKLLVVPPASQGSQPFIPATAVCTISGGAINAVTVTNQGAGYVAAPTIVVLNQPGDTTGSGAVLTPALTGAGQLTAIIMATPGTVQTSTPTMAFSGSAAPATAAATILMNYSLTNAGAGTVTAGSGITNGYVLLAGGGVSTATAVYTNPAIEKGIVTPVQPSISSASTTVVGLNNAASVNMYYGAGFSATTNLVLQPVCGPYTTAGAVVGPTVGGQNDVCTLYPI